MRLVKRSVNQDDVSAYHLFYADAKGSPGTDLTFFDWPVDRERRGIHAITRTSLRVNGLEALQWWSRHLRERGELKRRTMRMEALVARVRSSVPVRGVLSLRRYRLAQLLSRPLRPLFRKARRSLS